MKAKKSTLFLQKGFSVIELILTGTIFVIFSSGVVMAVISGLNLNRSGNEETVATQFASEGLEAVRSMRNQTATIISNNPGTGVIRNGSGVWQFSGSNNMFDKYTRVIKVESVGRDSTPPNGNIVAFGGTPDPDTKKVTSTVTWNFTSGNAKDITLTTYLTNWRVPTAPDIGNGLIVYDDGSTTPKHRFFDGSVGSFSSASDTIAGSSGRFFSMRTSPTKTEAIVGYVDASGMLRVMCFDGMSWTNEWNISVGGTGTTRRFDIGYETNSGDVMVVYSRNVTATNALAYRTKSGSEGCGSANWSTATNFATSPTATTGLVHWVRMARDSRSSSNTITVIWADSNADLGVTNWSGTAWATGTGTFKALETNLERISTAQDVDNFEVVYETISGNAMVVWGTAAGANGTNGARYSRCTGGVYTCSWTAAAAVPTVSDDVHNIDMTANPNSNQIAYAAIGNAGDDLTAAYWSGSAWTGYANLDISAESPFAGSKLVSTAWLIDGSATRWILNYDDSTGNDLSWYSAVPGSTPVKQADFNAVPDIGDVRERYDADFDPINQSRAMVTVSNVSRSVFAKRASIDASGAITWINADGSASLTTTAAIPQQGFIFQYWRSQ